MKRLSAIFVIGCLLGVLTLTLLSLNAPSPVVLVEVCVQDDRPGVCALKKAAAVPGGWKAVEDARSRGVVLRKTKSRKADEADGISSKLSILIHRGPARSPTDTLNLWLMYYQHEPIKVREDYGLRVWTKGVDDWSKDQHLSQDDGGEFLVACPNGPHTNSYTCTGRLKVSTDAAHKNFVVAEVSFNKSLLPAWRDVRYTTEMLVAQLMDN